MKNQLLIVMMALASLLFIANGASAEYRFPGEAGITGLEASQLHSGQLANDRDRFTCGFGISVCERSQKEGAQESEMLPATAGEQQRTEEFVPAGSSSHEGNWTPRYAPYEAPGESQPY